jgi:hypothetical protein
MFLLENTSFNLLHFSYCLQNRGQPTPNLSQTLVPSPTKLKRFSPSPTSREQPTSSASTSNSNKNNNKNEPITSTSTLSLSELSSILSRGNLSQDQLAQLTQTMLSHLPPESAASKSNSGRRTDKRKRTIACIELSSDGEEVVSLKKVSFIYSSFFPTDFLA